ncbi:hypothetical protein [Solemya velesiana gill symbiont]|uniref:Uncharacterized protein n=1 Tax=Solemya velesiana gill symbiont TaxID=1918948 RepID=A0A1T2KSI3_9GAMM|nr:hypothetical protein [Solemya velesiana gill symbiont]OOZ35751.1 hypothetical protein BOW51_10450 [Solemya velesiana gill symbiont]
MFRPLASLFVLVAASLLTACGGPRYQLVHDFIPPEDKAGRACLMACFEDKKGCGYDCEKRCHFCLEDARYDAEKSFDETYDAYHRDLREYSIDLELYYSELESYQDRKVELERKIKVLSRLCGNVKDKEARDLVCSSRNDVRRDLRQLKKPVKPRKPSEPTLEHEIARLQGACSKECGCDERYRTCYTSCGGTVIQRKVCVSNCDEAD